MNAFCPDQTTILYKAGEGKNEALIPINVFPYTPMSEVRKMAIKAAEERLTGMGAALTQELKDAKCPGTIDLTVKAAKEPFFTQYFIGI